MTEKRSEIDGMHILAVIDDGFDREYFELFFGRDRATVDIFYRHDLAAAAIDKKKYDAVVTDLCLWEDSPQPQAITFIEKCIEKKIPLAVTSAARWEYEIPQFERLVFVQTTEIVGGMYPAIKAAILEAIEKVEKANASELTGLQILVVDDEEDVTREIALLTQKGANVKHVKSHKIALEEMRRNKYSVVISDLLDLGEEKVGPETKAFMQECLKRGIPLVVLTNAGWDTVPEFEHVVLLHKLDLIMLSMNEKSNEHEKKWVSAIKTAIKTAKTAVVTDEKPPIDMDKPIGGGLLSKATYPKARVLFIGDAERGKKLDKELYSWYNVAVKTIETIAEALESLDRYSAVVIHEQYLNDKDYPKLIEICGKTGLEVVVQSNDASKGRRIISDPVDKKGIGHLELLVSIYEEEKMIKTIEKRGRGTVLVVENEEPQRFCIGSRVGKIADIIFAEDLDEGLERIKGKRIDVVIFDLRGVGQNLEEFCNKMYEKGIPMIVYTGAEWKTGTPAFDSVELVDKIEGVDVLMRTVFKKIIDQKPVNAVGDDVQKLLSYDWHIATPTEKWLRKLDAEEAWLHRVKMSMEAELKTAYAAPYDTSKREMDAMVGAYLYCKEELRRITERRTNPGKDKPAKRILNQ